MLLKFNDCPVLNGLDVEYVVFPLDISTIKVLDWADISAICRGVDSSKCNNNTV